MKQHMVQTMVYQSETASQPNQVSNAAGKLLRFVIRLPFGILASVATGLRIFTDTAEKVGLPRDQPR